MLEISSTRSADAGYPSGFEGLPLSRRVTHPGTHGFPDATFDFIFAKGLTASQPTVDRESVRLLAIELGVREAARLCGLSDDRVRRWSSRYKWLEQSAPKQQEAAVTVVTTPGDVLLATHKELEERTKTGLAQATARAAESAAKAEEPLQVSNTAQLRDLAQSAARIFGWNTDGPQVHLNQQVVITQEQLEQIRQLRGPTVYEAPRLEGRHSRFRRHLAP